MKTVKDWCGNPVTINKVKAWKAVQRTEGRADITSTFTPIVSNPDFVPLFWIQGLKNGMSQVFFLLVTYLRM